MAGPGSHLPRAAYVAEKQGTSFNSLRLAVFGLLLLGLAGIVSAPGSYDPNEHLLKVIKLVGAFGMVTGLLYFGQPQDIQRDRDFISSLTFRGRVLGGCRPAGQSGILTGLIHRSPGRRHCELDTHDRACRTPDRSRARCSLWNRHRTWTRYCTRKWLVVLPLIAIDVYSMRYSASLTAVFAFLFCFDDHVCFRESIQVLLSGVVAGALVMGMGMQFLAVLWVLLTSDWPLCTKLRATI